jgi:superfamily II DNA or RNA helicase
MILRGYQQEAIDAILAAYGRGVRAQLLAMATGAGKTVVFANLVGRRPGRALVLAHRDRLIQQAAAKLGAVLPWSDLGVAMAEQNRVHARCVVASVQTLARQRRLAALPKFDLVIVDECHRSAAKTYQRILAHVRHPETLLLGVTATPSRTDGIGLDKVYDEIVYQVGILDLIERGYLVPLRGQRITIEADFSKLKTQKNTDGISDYKADEVAEIMDKANWFEKASEGWLKYAADRRTIAFVPRVAMAYRLAEHLRGQGVRAVALDGSTPQHVQRKALSDFERGEVQFLSSCDLLTEGVDLPSANCALFARPTKSQIVYSQAIGRITRLSPETGKTDGLVLDMVGATNKFDLLTLGDLFGLRSLKDGETISQAVEREKKEEEEAAAEQMELPEMADGKVVGREVNLFGGRQPAPRKPLFEWQMYPEQRRAVLIAGGKRYEVWRQTPTAPYRFAMMDWSSRWEGVNPTWDGAKTAVEEKAKEIMFGGKDAPWRSAPASPKQIETMTRMRIRFNPHITKGEASDLLDARFKKARAA